MTLRAEILSIGDELTSGQRLDTNSRWLSEQLGNLGVKTVFHTTVGDTLSDNIDAFRTASRRADLVIASGGLGPTADDLTRQALSMSFDAPLELRQEAIQHIESLFAHRKRPMPERNRVQAMFPKGARIIDNPHGTAPGIDMVVMRDRFDANGTTSKCRIFALPGVPAEMMQMYRESVEPRLVLEEKVGETRWFFHTIKVFGIGESDVEARLPDLIERDRVPLVGITVSKATITLRIAALCSNQQEFDKLIKPTVQQIQNELGLLIFGEGDVDLNDAFHALLDSKRLKFGVIEVGASVLIQKWLAERSSCAEHGFVFGRWVPSMAALNRLVPDGVIIDVNREDANDSVRQLANAAEYFRRTEDLDLCLAVGPYPSLESAQNLSDRSVPEFHYALSRRGAVAKVTSLTAGAHPEVLYHRLAKAGLNFVRLELLQNA